MNGVERPKRSGNSRHRRVVSTGSAEGVELDILLSKLTSDNIEDKRSGAGEKSNKNFFISERKKKIFLHNGVLIHFLFFSPFS